MLMDNIVDLLPNPMEGNHHKATTQDGETQSVGGFEAVRDGTFAKMIEAAQGSDIDTVSGATITTAGVKQAVDDALAQAANVPADQAKSGN